GVHVVAFRDRVDGGLRRLRITAYDRNVARVAVEDVAADRVGGGLVALGEELGCERGAGFGRAALIVFGEDVADQFFGGGLLGGGGDGEALRGRVVVVGGGARGRSDDQRQGEGNG